MSNISYGVGEPTAPIAGATHYVDLETDYMYQFTNGEWVLYARNGIPLGDEYLYGYYY